MKNSIPSFAQEVNTYLSDKEIELLIDKLNKLEFSINKLNKNIKNQIFKYCADSFNKFKD